MSCRIGLNNDIKISLSPAGQPWTKEMQKSTILSEKENRAIYYLYLSWEIYWFKHDLYRTFAIHLLPVLRYP
jgi:hypothetical protein